MSQYGESVSIINLSTGMPRRTSRFSLVFREQPLTPAAVVHKFFIIYLTLLGNNERADYQILQ